MTEARDRWIEQANSLPLTVGKFVWLYPMLIFWGAAFGPLKPSDAPQVNTAPSFRGFAISIGLCFVPCLIPRSGDRPGFPGRSRRFYEAIGVHRFKRYVPHGDLANRRIRRHDPTYRIVGSRSDVHALLSGIRARERNHLVLLLLSLSTGLYALSLGWYRWAIVLTVGNTIFNLYPFLLQRYHRVRITTILDRAGRRR